MLTAIFRQPGILLAEIAWRWLFGISALALAAFAAVRLNRALTVYPEEQEMLASRSPIEIAQAILEIAHRARPIAVRLAMVVVPAGLLLWIVAATLGRGYVLSRISSHSSRGARWPALAVLNAMRVGTVILLVVAYFGCSIATSLVMNPYAPNYGLGVTVFLLLFALALASWSLVHWIVSTACIYCVRQHVGVSKALNATVLLLRENFRELFSISAQNASIRTLVAIVFTLIALPPLLVYRVPMLFWTVEIGLFLVYCLASDVLLLARLATYAEVTERTPAAVAAEHT